MENKAELEMKAAVMAYCEEVCPDTSKPRVLYDGFVAIWRKLKWNLSPYFEVTVGKSTIVLDDEFTNWGFMYTALGLDALDMHKENLIRITKQRMSAINGAMRWEARAWKLLQIAKDKSMESFAHSIRIAKLEADLEAALRNKEIEQ